MVVFREDRAVDARKGHHCNEEVLRAHRRIITSSQHLFAHREFPGCQISYPLADQTQLADNFNLYLAGTATVDFIERGGDAAMR